MTAAVISGPMVKAKGKNGEPITEPSQANLDVHAALGGLTTALYFTSAYYAMFAPRVPGTTKHGAIRLHEALALGLQAVWQPAPKAAWYASSNAYLACAAITNPGDGTSDPGFSHSRRAEEKAQAQQYFAAGVQYHDSQQFEGALQYLSSTAAQQQPFFMVISVVNPHDVLFYPSKSFGEAGYDGTWLEGNIHAPATADEDLSTKPSVQEEFLKIFNLNLLAQGQL